MITEIKIGVGKFISISNETTSDLNYILWNNGKWKISIALSVVSIIDSKTQKYDTFSMKRQTFLLFVTNVVVKVTQYLKRRTYCSIKNF